MTATPHRPTTPEAPHANDELFTLPEVAGPRPRARRHPALLAPAPPRLRPTKLPNRPIRPLLAQRRPLLARSAVQSFTDQALSLATV